MIDGVRHPGAHWLRPLISPSGEIGTRCDRLISVSWLFLPPSQGRAVALALAAGTVGNIGRGLRAVANRAVNLDAYSPQRENSTYLFSRHYL